VLGVLVPQSFVPHALDRLILCCHFHGVVLKSLPPVLTIDFFEPLNYFLFLETAQRLIFNVAVDVGARDIRMEITLQKHF